MNDLPRSAQLFDSLPDSAKVNVQTVAAINGISVVTVWRWSARGLLPKPTKPAGSNATRWRVGDLRAAMSRAQQDAA